MEETSRVIPMCESQKQIIFWTFDKYEYNNEYNNRLVSFTLKFGRCRWLVFMDRLICRERWHVNRVSYLYFQNGIKYKLFEMFYILRILM